MFSNSGGNTTVCVSRNRRVIWEMAIYTLESDVPVFGEKVSNENDIRTDAIRT